MGKKLFFDQKRCILICFVQLPANVLGPKPAGEWSALLCRSTEVGENIASVEEKEGPAGDA